MHALSKERLAELARVAEREREAARAHERASQGAAVTHGSSLRLRDGRWVHLRHDSA
jgi:hypothetical protein